MSWSEPILHVDMDAFFVEVERIDRPELRGRRVAVGGTGPRGVISSASYEARESGVRSAQPTGMARAACPGLVVLPPDHAKYSEVSVRLFGILRDVSPLVEGVSVDEAFMDVGGLRLHHSGPEAVADLIRARIRTELGLPASVGVAPNKLVAKLASAHAKPDGVRHIRVGEMMEFLGDLPASALWGVGPATLAGLERLGLGTVGEVAEVPERVMVEAFGPTLGAHLLRLARGEDHRAVEPDSEAKSISVEETYFRDLETLEEVETALLAHADRLSTRLRRAGLRARTVTLKIRYPDFTTVTRQRSIADGAESSRILYEVALSLAAEEPPARPVRLLGLGGSSLVSADAPRQLALEDGGSWEQIESAVVEIRDRFGDSTVGPARLARRPGGGGGRGGR